MPALEELIDEQIAAFLKEYQVDFDQLPYSAIRRKIEDDIEPGAYLTPHTVGPDLLAMIPVCRVRLAADILGITSGAVTVVTFDTEEYDSGTVWDPTNSTTKQRLVCPIPGIYHLDAGVCWGGATGGARNLRLRASNSGLILAEEEVPTSTTSFTQLTASCDHKMAAGDYFYIETTQTSGVPLDLKATSTVAATFASMHFVSNYQTS